MDTRVKILNQDDIKMKLLRIAYQIVENHFDKKNIILAGIAKSGVIISQTLKKNIESISSLKVELVNVIINKKNPIECKLDQPFSPKNKHIIIVDDVSSSGRTITYAQKPFLDEVATSIQTAVLVDRKHKQFPISPDYVGLQLSTTLQEKITVVCENDQAISAYLD